MQIDEKWLQNNGKYKCPYCAKEYTKKGISTHIWRKHGEGRDHNPNKGYENGSRAIWNKGQTKETSSSVKQGANTLSRRIDEGEIDAPFLGKKHSAATKLKISKKLSQNNKGGRCQWYDYVRKDQTITKLQGTWEVRFAKILDLIDENWIKPTKSNKDNIFLWTDDKGVQHYYTPDFYSPKLNKYFEVKGYWWGNDKRKMELVLEQHKNINIEMIFKKDLEKYEKLFGSIV